MQRKRTNRNKDTAQERLQSPHATHQYCTFQMLIPAGPMLCCSPRPLLPFPILIHNPLLAGQQGRMAGGQQGLREKESALPPPNPSSPHRWGHPFRAIGSIVCPIKTILRSPMLLAQGTSSLGFTTPPSNLLASSSSSYFSYISVQREWRAKQGVELGRKPCKQGYSQLVGVVQGRGGSP